MRRQYIPEDMMGNTHKITISLIGAGGTGSLLLNQLCRINIALIGLGKKGIHVRCFDHDIVTESNLGRQNFNELDIDLNKADVLISRINMFYGFQWESYNLKVTDQTHHIKSNIIFICVDNIKARKDIYTMLKGDKKTTHEFQNHYVIDCGNEFKTGQVYLSNSKSINQPDSKYETISYIPNPIEKYGKGIYQKDNDNVPSCSLAQALGKQDLMINQFVADTAAKMFWDMLQHSFIFYNETFINLSEGIKIQNNKL